jgi:hypothetical protein
MGRSFDRILRDQAAAYYRLERDRGKDHHAAVRTLAFKWNPNCLSLLERCLP